jgi:pimeloyl-ACP methyl ester carboxylesterase
MNKRNQFFSLVLGCIGVAAAIGGSAWSAARKGDPMVTHSTAEVHYRAAKVDGLEIFYREAGPSDAPTLLLLHGFPTSSHMFRDLIPLLADRYRIVAPDYPGFGYSSMPTPREFDYTFDHLADVMEHFTDTIGLRDYALYLQDFGGPVGLRLAARHPERVHALVIQNANAYEEGFSRDECGRDRGVHAAVPRRALANRYAELSRSSWYSRGFTPPSLLTGEGRAHHGDVRDSFILREPDSEDLHLCLLHMKPKEKMRCHL